MDKQRLKAYLNLIQELLTCPNGEEWIRLRKHEPIVNAELVQVMEQVAAQLALDGDAKSARYLHNWAGKLHHILMQPQSSYSIDQDKTNAYQDLIQALIECPEGMEAQLLQANQHLIDPGLASHLQRTAQQLATQGDLRTAEFLKELSDQVTRLWMEVHSFRPELSKQESSPDLSKVKPPSHREFSHKEPSSVVPSEEIPSPSPISQATLSTVADLENQYQHLAMQLKDITEAIHHLTELISTSEQHQASPLAHLEALEKACSNGWVLSTEEVESLIGIKPHCPSGSDTFQRGNWDFIKIGRLGPQTAWRVSKNETAHAQ